MLLLLLLSLLSLAFSQLPKEYELFIEYRQSKNPEVAYRILREYPNAVFKDDLMVMLAKELYSKGKEEEAKRLILQVDPKNLKEDLAEEFLRLWKGLSLDPKRALLNSPVLFREFIPQVNLTTEDALSVSSTLYRRRFYKEVIRLLEPMEYEKVCYTLSKAYRALGDREKAIQTLESCTDERAKGELAVIYFEQGLREKAEGIVSSLEDTRVLQETLLRLGRLSLQRGDYSGAAEYFSRMEMGYVSQFQLGLSYYALGDHSRALESFQRALNHAKSKEEQTAANFWVYKCKVLMSHEDALEYLVKASDGVGFYHAVASSMLGVPVASRALRVVIEDEGLPKTAEVIRSINRAGFPHYARLEALKRLSAMSSSDIISISAFDPNLAVRLAVRKFGHGSLVYSAVAFLTPYRKEVQRASEAYGADRALIYAVIRQESLFDPYALSVAGAKGLMQLIDSTASYVAKREGINLEDVYDPGTNILLGTAYLRYLINMWNGDLVKALASYNAGPNRVKGWADQEDQYLYIELIPLQETRDYVKRVLYNYYVYSELLK